MVRVLLVANKTPGSQEISEFVKSRMQTEGCRFTVLVPATQRNEPEPTWLARSVSGDWAGPQWTQEAEDNYAHARARLEYGLDLLRSWGADVDGQVGDPDPGKAIKEVLATEHYDEVALSMLPEGISRWLRLDIPHQVERKFHVPVTVIKVP